MGEITTGVVPGFEPASDTHQNDATTGDGPMIPDPAFVIPSWADVEMPNWPAGVHNTVQDCAEQTAKFQQGKKP
jgi:hypothetical protein